MAGITTHVLDTALGHPAAGVSIALERSSGETWEAIGRGETDADGRLRTLMPEGESPAAGIYRLVFDTRRYFAHTNRPTLYPQVIIVFETTGDAHYHVPLLLSPFGYSTYRGS